MKQSNSHTAHLIPQRSSPWLLQASLLLSGPANNHCNPYHFHMVHQIFPKRVCPQSSIPPACQPWFLTRAACLLLSRSMCQSALCLSSRNHRKTRETADMSKKTKTCVHLVVMEAFSSNSDHSNAGQVRPRTMSMRGMGRKPCCRNAVVTWGRGGSKPNKHSAHPEAQVPVCFPVRHHFFEESHSGLLPTCLCNVAGNRIEDTPAVLCASNATTVGEHQNRPTHSKRSLRNHPE